MWLHVLFISRAVINICGVLWLILRLHNEVGWRSSPGSSQVGGRPARTTLNAPATNSILNRFWNAEGGKKYPSFCSFCLLWQNRGLIYRQCKLCRSALFLNFHWWRNCFTAPSSASTATITTDVNTLVNDLSSQRSTAGPTTKKVVEMIKFFLKHGCSENSYGGNNTKGPQSTNEIFKRGSILRVHDVYMSVEHASCFLPSFVRAKWRLWNLNPLCFMDRTLKLFSRSLSI